MPIIVQSQWFTRDQLRSEPHALFAWGDNLARIGGADNANSGQAYACRGEPNAIGIPTKHTPANHSSSFFRDQDYSLAKPEIDAAFLRLVDHLRAGGTVYWPAEGIGTGRARLKTHAPAIWIYLQRCRSRLFEISTVIRR